MKQLITILLLVIFFASPLLAQTQSVVTKPALQSHKQSHAVLARKRHKRHNHQNKKKHGHKASRRHHGAAGRKA
jgi:Ni/Co efflux regulator RcnB